MDSPGGLRICVQNEGKEYAIHIFTDGGKNEHGVGWGTPIYIQNKLKYQLKHKIHDRYSINQAEQMTIIKALEAIETININNNIPRKIIIHTDSRITLEALKTRKIEII